MATSSNAAVQVETASVAYANQEMVDNGLGVFTVTGVDVFSGDPDVDVKPDGIKSGTQLVSTHATVDTVQYPGFNVQIAGLTVAVSAGTIAITRPLTAVSKVCTLTADSSGTVAEVEGTDGTTTAFTETYNVAGGPPYIPVSKVMFAQIRVTSDASAVITAAEIKQNPGQHAEYTNFPDVKTIDHTGMGDIFAATSAKVNAYIEFTATLPLTHTAGVAKDVYIDYAVPTMTGLDRTLDYTPCENSHGVNSTTFYKGSDASKTTSLGQGSFTVRTNDNITDFINRRKDKQTIVDMYPDEDKTPFIRTMATLGMTKTFPADDQNQMAVTMTSLKESADFTA